jgi:hypothetical protein
MAAQNSSATLRVFHLIFALRMASARYPRTARIVQPKWGRPQGERSRWAGGAASFCRVARACGAAAVRGPSASGIEDPILAAQNSSAALKVFHLVFAFRMASVRYPFGARVVQPQLGRPQEERRSWAGGAASFCRVARACGAAAAWGS